MFAAIQTRLRALRQRRRAGREMDDELRFHVEMETQAHIARGVPATEARRLALRDLGGVDQTREAIRDVRAIWLESAWQDVRYAFRTLGRRPGTTVTAIAMLGLGIGLTAAMFTIVDALILRPVPFRQPEDLAFVYMGDEHGGRTVVAPSVLRVWRESAAFAGAEAAVPAKALLDLDGVLAVRGTARVTPGIFDLLGGVRPVRGRLFDASEGRPGNDDRVLISEDLWRDLYQADAGMIGRRISVDGKPAVVIGILPSEFRFPSWDTAVWRPSTFESAADPPMVYVRFANGMPRTDAERIAMDAARTADARNARLWPRVEPLAGQMLDPYYARAVPALAVGVVLVFLILCANVSSLLLARLSARQREFSMRSALGASRGRLMRQTFVETTVLGAIGIAAGIGIGWLLVSLARSFLPEAFLLRTLNPLDLDVRAIAVTSFAGCVAIFASGLLPAWIGTRVDVDQALRVTDRGGTETRAARRATRVLLAGEIALACTLLVGATLLVRSFVNLAGANRGLDTAGMLTSWMSMTGPAFPDAASRMAAARAIEEQVRALPGVQQVAWSYGAPPDHSSYSMGDWVTDTPGASPVDLEVDHYNVGPRFFGLYGIALLKGRLFAESDPADTVVIGERLARSLWPAADPLGRTFAFEKRRFHVVGVVREIHLPTLDGRLDRPEFYERLDGAYSNSTLSIRCAGTCPDLAAVRQRIMMASAAVKVHFVRALEEAFFEELARPRAAAALGFTFAAIAVVAAAGGLFSVLSYAVGRRKREFGIRTALGASSGQLRRLVLRDGLSIALVGIALGAVAAWWLGRALASLQYGVTVADPISWGMVIALLGATVLLACWRPAAQATSADPVMLLRED
jgi:predicted permease